MELLKSFPGNRYARAVYVGLFLFIPLIIIIPGWGGFAYSPRSSFSDLTISHFPNALFLLDSLREGQFPLWSPMLFAGYPFAADPLSGLWYLPGWLALLFPLPLGFNLTLFAHLMFTGAGMWLFLHENNFGWLPSIGGAWMWELMPKIFAHIGAGHVTLIYAVAWTPWLLLAVMKRDKTKFSYWTGIILAMIILADIRWSVYAGLLWLAFSFWQEMLQKHKSELRDLVGWAKYVLVSVVIAVILSAPLILPLAEFSSLSTRSLMSVEDNLSLSLTPVQLFGFLAPNFGGYAEWVVYFGGIFLLILIWVLTHRDLRKASGFWLLVLMFTLLLSLGSYFPPNQWIARLPGMDLLRVPSRFMIVFGFAASMLTTLFLKSNPLSFERRVHFWGNLLTAGIVIFSWIIAIGLWLISGLPPWQNLWGTVFLTSGFILLFIEKSGKTPQFYIQVGFLLLMLLDLGSVSKSNFKYIDQEAVLNENSDIASQLSSQNELVRIYSPSYSLPQQTAASFRLETVNGIDPLQLRSFINFFGLASGTPTDKYSVTVPPFAEGNLSLDNRDYAINPQLMGWLNVKYIVSAFQITSPYLAYYGQIDDQFLYTNQAVRPRAWIQPDNDEADQYSDTVSILKYSPNTISLEGTGPGYLVLADVIYPGWKVKVDGKEMDLLTIHQLLRGVYLSTGKHQVVFSFRPDLLYISMACAVSGWLWLIFQILFSRRGYWQRQKKDGC